MVEKMATRMYIVKQLRETDLKLADAICESLKTAYDPSISKFFAHQDLGYKRFFKQSIKDPNYYTYYCFDPNYALLQGFACFQKVGNVIFLKNIVVDNRFRGSKIGTTLLKQALSAIQKTDEGQLQSFQLDVFEKNHHALRWYLSIGMQATGCTYWYDLTPSLDLPIQEQDMDGFEIVMDNFGFRQVKYRNEYIGTLLATNTLVARSEKIMEVRAQLPSFMKHYTVQAVGLVSNKELDFSLIDKAFRMSIPLIDLNLED